MSENHPPASPSNRASSPRLEQPGASDSSLTTVHAQLLREKAEPTEGFSPVPIFVLFVFSALIFTGGIYIGEHTAGFSPLAFDVTKGAAAAGPQGPAKAADPMVAGRRLFNQNCVACHQMSGTGMPGIYPPLAGSEFVTGSEERLVRILLHGLQGPLVVNGANYGQAAMPAFGPQSGYRFNEERIAQVLTYVRGSFGNNAPPVTPEKVKEIMAAAGDRTTSWSAAELEAFK